MPLHGSMDATVFEHACSYPKHSCCCTWACMPLHWSTHNTELDHVYHELEHAFQCLGECTPLHGSTHTTASERAYHWFRARITLHGSMHGTAVDHTCQCSGACMPKYDYKLQNKNLMKLSNGPTLLWTNISLPRLILFLRVHKLWKHFQGFP
jgi:hypothetical protein